jgi:hypothetical protein
MKTKLDFGKRGREETKRTERRPTTMERLKRIARRWWPRLSEGGQGAPIDAPGAKLKKSRSLPQRRP